MKHNKKYNVGIIFEAINKKIVKHIISGEEKKANKLYEILSKYFIDSDNNMKWVYKNIYSPVLYSEANNYYYANSFLNYLADEYLKVNHVKLNEEINSMFSDLNDCGFTIDDIMSEKINNFKLFASLKCLLEDVVNKKHIKPSDKINCQKTIFEHMINNKESQRIKVINSKMSKNKNDINNIMEEKMVLGIAIKKFKERYKDLKNEQLDLLFKYMNRTSDLSFNRYCEKKLINICEQIKNKLSSYEIIKNESLATKLKLVLEKYNRIIKNRKFDDENLTEIFLALDLQENLKY